MSMDIFVYGDNFKDVSKEGCEKYLLQFDLKAEMHPEVHIETAGGFLPFRIEFLSIDSLKGKLFLSGFEVYHDTYDYIQDQKNIRETSTPPVKKRGGIMGLFKKAKGTTESVQNFIKSPEFMESSEIESALKNVAI